MSGRRRRVFVLAALAAAAGGVCAGRSAASDKLWTNPLGGSFHDNLNWDSGVPGALDNAVFNLGSLLPYVVNISSDVSNKQLLVGNDQLQLASIPGVTYSLTSASASVPAVVVGDLPGEVGQLSLLNATIAAAGQVVVGADGDGTLTIPGTSRLIGGDASIGFVGAGHLFIQTGGGFATTSGSIGQNAGANGVVVVEDLTSSWINSGNLFVGDFGTGSLTIANAGLVQSGGVYSGYAGTGSIAVDSNGALRSNSFIRVGDTASAVGTFNITAGGTAESVDGLIGVAGGSGSVVVDGIQSRWTMSGALQAGWSGEGTMTIQNHGVVFAAAANIGGDVGGDGTVTVSGTDSMLNVSGLLSVGNDGKGTLLVDSGGSVVSGGGVIGASSAGPNVASIDGGGSSWNMGANQLIVGDDGSGTLEVSGAATVSNGAATIGRGTGGDGTVVLDQAGTSWTNGGLLNVGLNGSGLLQVSGGAVVNGTTAVVGGDAASGAAGSGAVVISGTSSKWNLSSSVTAGGGGVGNVALSGGAKLIDASAIVGDGTGSTGIVELEGSGTSWTSTGAVSIGNNGTGDVTIESGASGSSGALDVGINEAGNLTVTGAGSGWTSNGIMRVGVGHFGTLSIDSGGAVVSPSATVGAADGAIGQVLVNNGSSWNNPGILNVGRGGADGIVALDHGGQLSSGPANIGGDGAAGSGNGAVFVRSGSHWTAGAVALGLGGSGDMEIMGGGVVDAASMIISTGLASSQGTVQVFDAASRLNVAGAIEVGRGGTGKLEIGDGAIVSSAAGTVGTLASGSGMAFVTGAGSRWNINGNLELGVNGGGGLNIFSGGVVSAVNCFVARGAPGSGIATISGSGTQMVLSDSMYIGGDSVGPLGNGIVVVANAATVSATNQIKIWATGVLNFNGGSVSSALVDLQGGLISGGADITSPVSSTNGRISSDIDTAIILSGPLGIVSGSNLTKQGAGALHINGPQNHGAGATLNVAGGSVVMNSDAGTPATAAAAASANLIVRVSGSGVTLGADQEMMELNVEFANPGSQSFNLNSPATAGAFRSVRIYSPDLVAAKSSIYAAMTNANAGGAVDPTDGVYDSGLSSHANSKLGIAQLTDVHGDPVLLIRPTRIGDLNLDGTVTISDFIDLASNFNGLNKTWQEGDLNYDGSVTISDFIDLASNFNGAYSGLVQGGSQSEPYQTLANFASSIGVDPAIIGSAVPEPGCLVLAAVATSMLATRRRRR